jgi:lipoate-protein ligase A
MSDYEPATWRLVWSEPADGATNMAVDEAILRAVAAGHVPPTLRFYAWEPPCLSLGRGQRAADVDLDALREAGYGLVRRPTGGKAILHIDELTYSVVAPETEPRVAGGVVSSYRRLSAGLMRGLEQLGVLGVAAEGRDAGQRAVPSPVRRGGVGHRRRAGPVCFEVPSDYEITAQERKLIGSAQMRAGGVVLQHGAVPLYGDISRICALLVSRPGPARVRAGAATVEQALVGRKRRRRWRRALPRRLACGSSRAG